MMTWFNKLPKRYQKVLNEAVQDVDGGESPEIVAAWKEYEAETILESKLDALNFKTTSKQAGEDYAMFREGWKAGMAEANALHEALNKK